MPNLQDEIAGSLASHIVSESVQSPFYTFLMTILTFAYQASQHVPAH